MHDFEQIAPCIQRLARGPEQPEAPFTAAGRSYAQLYGAAAGLRPVLRDGSGSPWPVCLASEDKFTVAAAMLAGLGAGAPLVLPHALSPAVLAELRTQTGCRQAIVDRFREMPAGMAPIVVHREGQNRPWTAETTLRDLDCTYARLFTGGSTGRPQVWSKSVRNLWGEALNLAHTFQVTAADRILATVPPNHIYGLLFSVLLALVSGARLIEETPVYPREIVSAMENRRATLLVGVPIHYLALQNTALGSQRPRLAFSSGGMLEADVGDAFSNRTGVPIVEVYGSTETGGIATRCRTAGEKAFTPFPVVNWKIEAGYLAVNSGFLSAELARDAGGYYQTADRVQEVGGGRFELLGRADGIVKVGGKRVDLDQIREILIRAPGVREAVVLPVKASKGHETGIAALVAGETTAEALKKRLRSHLPPHARPRRIRVVAQIPHTSAGKPDRETIAGLLS